MPQSMGELEYETQSRNHHAPEVKSKVPLKKKEKKWTLGSLFRRKKTKESDSESSDSDAAEDGKKRGFLARRRRRRSANRGSKDVSQSFEHVDLRSGGGSISSDGSRRSLKARVEANRDSLLKDSSSDEERSPRPRVPRSKRSSREIPDGQVKVMDLDSSPRSPRWTAKVVYCESSDYEARYTARTRSASPSPAQSPVARVKHAKRPPIPQANAPRSLGCQKSASFDLLPKQTQRLAEPQPRVPPPPPPRDPQRKIVPPTSYLQQDRPLSYAFESDRPMTIPKVMTDHNSNITAYKVDSSCSLNDRPVYKINSTISLDNRSNYRMNSTCSLDQPSHRVNSSRSLDQPIYETNGTGSWDKRRTYQYYTDQQPRSRRPIHIARVDQPYLSDSQVGRIRPNDWRMPRDSNSSLYDSSDSREGGMDARPLSMVVETSEQLPQQTRRIDEPSEPIDIQKRKSGNLEDALNELEAIYKSLQLRDEEPSTNRGFESDSGCNYRVVDDMAYRRLNRRDSGGSPDCRRVMSQAGSYLLVSPTLSPPPFATAPLSQSPLNEPDVTLDDVVYRNMRHTNNTLRISDPQPPFGIPLGPITPGAGSDYLHAAPKQLYRPTFKPRKTPDIVKDDLAYRNLRKDGQQDSLLSTEDFLSTPEHTPSSILKKKRAVRSLSANLLSIIQKEQFNENSNFTNYGDFDRGNYYEKTQSYSDLPDVLNSRYKCTTDDPDVTPRVSRLYSDLPMNTTSTETLTDSRANIMNAHDSSFLGRHQRLPTTTSKPIPKTQTDLVKLTLPNSQQILLPKKYLQYNDDDDDVLTIGGRTKTYSQNQAYNRNYLNNYSSPNGSVSVAQRPLERTNAKSPSPYYNQFIGKPTDSKFPVRPDQVKEKLSGIKSLGHDARDLKSSAVSPNAVRRNYCENLQAQVNRRLSNSDNHFINSTEIAHFNSTKKQIPENVTIVKSSVPFVTVSPKHQILQNNNSDVATPPKLSAQKDSNVEIDQSLGHVSNNSSGNSNEQSVSHSLKHKICNEKPASPKGPSKRISIEGIKINMTPTNKTKSLKENSFLNTEAKPTKSASVSNTNKLKSNPSVSISHHEKSHIKNDTKATRSSQPVEQSTVNGNGNKSGKPGMSRTRSAVVETNVEKIKNSTSSVVSLPITSEKEISVHKAPSQSLSVNPVEKVKSKSASPRLSVKSSSCESLKQKLPGALSEKHTKPSNSPDNLNLSVDETKVKSLGKTSSTTVKSRQHPIGNEGRRKLKGKSLSLNSGLATEHKNIGIDSKPRLTKTISLTGPLHSENGAFVKTGSNVSNEIHGQTIDSSIVFDEDYSTINSTLHDIPSLNDSKDAAIKDINDDACMKLENDVEKDLNRLLSEINIKQDEILAGGSECKPRMDKSVENVKRDSLMLGKIIPHKPVILTTFSIGNNNTIENSETMIDDNKDKILGSSESMTDLLLELTRSLDQDFGCLDVTNDAQDTNVQLEDVKDLTRSQSSGKVEVNKISTDTEDDLTVDEADNEVMEINRKVLMESCVVGHNINRDKVVLPSNGYEKDEVFSSERDVRSSETSEDVVVKSNDHNSDDSNAEFVEAICKTASELSNISNSSNIMTSSHHHQVSPLMVPLSSSSESSGWNRHVSSCDLDQTEGTSSRFNNNSNKLNRSPLVIHPSGLLLFCTYCIAQLQQFADLDFLTVLGILIAIISLVLLLVL